MQPIKEFWDGIFFGLFSSDKPKSLQITTEKNSSTLHCIKIFNEIFYLVFDFG